MSTVGALESHRDESGYAGDVSTSVVSPDYLRSKVLEFQQMLQGLDMAYQAAESALYIEGIDPQVSADLTALMQEYESKKATFKATAEAVNLGAAAWNAIGGRMPSLSIPRTLGLAPAVPIVLIVAVAGVATLLPIGWQIVKGINERLKFQMQLDAQLTPEGKAMLAQADAQADAAVRLVDASSGIASIAPYVKWGAIALAAWLAWRAFSPLLKESGTPDSEDD